MGIEKVLCFLLGHLPDKFPESNFEYYCTRCYKIFIDSKGLYTENSRKIYSSRDYPNRLEELKIMKNEAKANSRE